MEEKTMSKNAIQSIIALLQEKNGLTHADAEKLLRLISDVVNTGLRQEKLVKIKGLGTFKLQAVRDRESVDVNTGERIVIEGRDKISFTPDNVLKEIVNKPFSGFDTVVIGDGVSFDEIDKKYEDSLQAENIEEPVKEVSPEDSEKVQEVAESTVVDNEQEKDALAKDSEKTPDEINGNEINNDVEAKTETAAPTKVSTPTEQADSLAEELSIEPEDNSTDTLCMQGGHVIVRTCVYRLLCFSTVFLLLSTFVLGYLLYKEKSKGLPDVVGTVAVSKEEPAKENSLPDSTAIDSAKEEHAVVPSQENGQANSNVEKEKQETESNSSHHQAKTSKELKAAEKTEAKNTVRQQEEQTSPYDKDPRIRYGAYRITGVEQTVTVQKGQTFSSISKAYLGAEMECYMEAVNGGKIDVKAGDKLKIPRLELRKKKRK